jgi:hypothetical protein
MKRFGFVLALLAVVVFAAPASAQEQTGVLVGKIIADGGEPLPGVSVEAKGPSGTLVAVTDARGEYRFPRVTPGTYKVTARLQGFQTYEASRVPVALGDRATLNVTLRISSVMETVVVTGERVQIAVGENSTAANIGAEQIAMLPKGRDFTTVVTSSPGVKAEAFTGGIQIDGASGSENRFVIDGVDTTNALNGLSGQAFVTDFLEEVQVKSAGYAAEYGGALGGVINAITKSGTNEFHGWLGAYYSNSSLNGDERPTQYEADATGYRTFAKDDDVRIEPGFGLGGPILKENLWFYVGYNPSFQTIERTPAGKTRTDSQDNTNHYFVANLKGNVGSKFVYKVSANLSPRKSDGSLPNRDGTTADTVDLALGTDFKNESYSAYGDFVPSGNFYMTVRGGYWKQDAESFGSYAPERVFFRNGTIPVPTSDPRYHPPGWASVPAAPWNAKTDQDLWTRKSAGLDFNYFLTAAGSHSIKAGVQYEKLSNSVATGEAGNLYEIRWGLPDRFGAGVIGTYGSIHVRRFGTFGDVTSDNLGFYIQDTWAVVPNLTLNLGVRTEQEKIPNYSNVPGAAENAFDFSFGDKFAPRLGFSWDVGGKQKTKVYGSYGSYYDITKLTVARGSFGGDKWIAYLYPLNTLDWNTIPGGCSGVTNNASINPCPSLGTPTTLDLRHPNDPLDPYSVDPNIKPMENREFQLGGEYQLTKNAVVSVRYVNKKLMNTIEDIGVLRVNPDGSREEVYTIANPGKGVVGGDPDGDGPIPARAEAIRDYEAVELTYNRRFADNFSLRAAYTYSRLTGNYSGLASTDEFGRTDPNVARYFDGRVSGYTQNGELEDGPLNTDRPHAFELYGAYRMPWNTTVGLNAYWRSGGASSTEASYNGVMYLPYGRNDMGRLPSLTSFDLLLAHPFDIGGVQIEVSVNVLNLLDSDTVTQIENAYSRDDVCFTDACDGSDAFFFGEVAGQDFKNYMDSNGATKEPYYGKPLAWQTPRTFRLAVKASF